MTAKDKPAVPDKEGKKVREAYLKRITGYDVTETKKEYKVNEEGERVLIRETENTKHVPGDPRAAEFWLMNRESGEWRSPKEAGRPRLEPGETGVVELPAVQDPSAPPGGDKA